MNKKYNHRYPLICFDLDGTLVDDTVYIWTTLHETLKTDGKLRKKAYDDYFAGRISYREWFEHDLFLFKKVGADRSRLLQIIETLRPMTGALQLLKELREEGYKLAVISGSLDLVVKQLFETKAFDHIFINEVQFDKRGQIVGGIPTRYDLDGKADGLRELARLENLSMDQTAFVGDNENDIWIAKAAGKGIAFNCKSDSLREVCDVEVLGKDLRAIREHLD
jgi:phosphoserine phosphatase